VAAELDINQSILALAPGGATRLTIRAEIDIALEATARDVVRGESQKPEGARRDARGGGGSRPADRLAAPIEVW
jgi:hypothetical protein